MQLNFSGEWCLINKENIKLSGCVGYVGDCVIEHVYYKLLLLL